MAGNSVRRRQGRHQGLLPTPSHRGRINIHLNYGVVKAPTPGVDTAAASSRVRENAIKDEQEGP